MTNQAAWIKEKLAAPLEVGDAPLPRPGDDAVLLRVSHAAVNPGERERRISEGLVHRDTH